MARRRPKTPARIDPRLRRQQPAAREEIELQQPTVVKSALHRWGPIALIALITFVAYYPSYNNGFVSWDDDHYVFDNHQVHYTEGIASIWGDIINYRDKKYARAGDMRVSHQYYPLLFTTFWLEFRFHQWFEGADPHKTVQKNIDDGKMTATSFHVVNTVLHVVNCMLLIMCFRMLGISNWVAWAATIIFAVHPMQVASVAWVTERKNIMALMFYLLSMMSYIRLRRSGHWWWYVIALVSFQSALFSKTVALTLPAMLFFTDRLLEKRWYADKVFKSVLRVVPFLALSIVAALVTMRVEDRNRTIPLRDDQRPLVAGATVMFYPSKMLVPTQLSPIYPLWEPDTRDLTWYLPLFSAITLAALIAVFHRRLGRHFVWAVLFYAITQFPMLGFKNINYFQFAFVADHYFYNGAPGLCLAFALALGTLRRHRGAAPVGAAAASILVLAATVACGYRTYKYTDTWQDAETFWVGTLKMNPRCWPAWYNRANQRRRDADDLLDAGERAKADKLYEEAADFYWKVADIHKKIRQPFDALIQLRVHQGKLDLAYSATCFAADRFAFLPDYHLQAGEIAVKLGKYAEAVKHYDNLITVVEQRRAKDEKERRQLVEDTIDFHLRAARAAREAKLWADVMRHYADRAALLLQLNRELRAAEAYIFAADAATKLGDTSTARDYYTKGKEIKLKYARQYEASGRPGNAAPAYADAALAAKMLNEPTEAKGLFVKSAELYLVAGDSSFEAGNYDKAFKRYQMAGTLFGEATKIDPNDASLAAKIQLTAEKMQQAETRKGKSRADTNQSRTDSDNDDEDDGD